MGVDWWVIMKGSCWKHTKHTKLWILIEAAKIRHFFIFFGKPRFKTPTKSQVPSSSGWFSWNLCLWLHFKNMSKSFAISNNFFDAFEISLQGGHGKLSQWRWRWHEAQGQGVQCRWEMLRDFFCMAQGYVKSAPYHNWFHAPRQNTKHRTSLDILRYQA